MIAEEIVIQYIPCKYSEELGGDGREGDIK